jgi:hypothetical protein
VVGPNADTITPFYGNYNPRPVTCPTLVEALREKLARNGAAAEVIAVRGCTYARSAISFDVVPDACLRHDNGLQA